MAALGDPLADIQLASSQSYAGVIKADVMAETEAGAKTRGSSRRSAHAVAAGRRTTPVMTPAAPAADDYEMEI